MIVTRRKFCIFLFPLLYILMSANCGNCSADNAAPENIPQRTVQCSVLETRCWNQGKLLHTDGNCYAPLQQGPCPDGKWFALSGTATRNFLQGKCVELACPPDTTSSQCRMQMQAHAQTCPQTSSGVEEFAVHVNPMGQFRCGNFPGRVRSLHDAVMCAPNQRTG